MNSLPPDPYKILDLKNDANINDIRTAYRKRVLKCHPDKNLDKDAKTQDTLREEFQRVQQAYELLADDNERQKYDDQVRLMELRKEMHKNMAANTSSPRTPPRSYNVRNVEPRTDSYKSPQPTPKVYAQYPPARSWDSDLHTTSARVVEEVTGRSARRTASYEKGYEKPSRRDEERERERDRRRRKEKEREREEEAERLARVAEKDARREEKKRKDKERDKERKVVSEEKRRHKPAYVESYPEEEVYVQKPEKKKSRSKVEEQEKREKSQHRDDPTAQKMDNDIAAAFAYLQSSRERRGPTAGSRFEQTPMAVPTPPPAGNGPFPVAPSPVEDEEVIRRSSAKPSSRRPSYDSPRSKEKIPHKKSGSREHFEEPAVFASSPSTRAAPSFSKYSSTPPTVPASPPRREIPRSNTMNESTSYSRPVPTPLQAQGRAQTFHTTSDLDGRGRSRSRNVPQVVEEAYESEDDRRHRDARKHRSSRHKTHSPEPVQYMDIPRQQTTHYTVAQGHTVRLPTGSYYGQSPEKSHSKSHTRDPRGLEIRPGMPPRDSGYSSSAGPYFKVKTSKSYADDDINYSSIPHSNSREGYVW